MQYKFKTDKTHRFTYTVPRIRGRQEIQYPTGYSRSYEAIVDGFTKYSPYRTFVGGSDTNKKGTGLEQGSYMLIEKDKPINSIRQVYVSPGREAVRGVDSGMGFKDNGKIYRKGDVSIYSIQQGVSVYTAPELLFNGNATYDFDGERETAFDLETEGLGWLDTNNGLGDVTISKGGTLYRIGGTKRTVVGTYKKTLGDDTGSFTPAFANSLVIPSNEIDGSVNVFQYELVNDPIGLRNEYTIRVFVNASVTAEYVDQLGRRLEVTNNAWRGPHVGRVGDDFTLTYPKAIGNRTHVSTQPTGLGTPVSSGVNNTINTKFTDDLKKVTFVYQASDAVDLTIQFLRTDTDEPIFKDFKVDQALVNAITVKADRGDKIADVIQLLISTNQMKLNYPGYRNINAGDFEIVAGGSSSDTTIGTVPMTIVYKYQGKLDWK